MCTYYTTSLSSICRHIWSHWAYWTNIPVKYILPSVCLRLSQLPNYHSCNIRCCVYSAHPFLVIYLWKHMHFILSSDVSPICQRLGLGHEALVCFLCFLYSYSYGVVLCDRDIRISEDTRYIWLIHRFILVLSTWIIHSELCTRCAYVWYHCVRRNVFSVTLLVAKSYLSMHRPD